MNYSPEGKAQIGIKNIQFTLDERYLEKYDIFKVNFKHAIVTKRTWKNEDGTWGIEAIPINYKDEETIAQFNTVEYVDNTVSELYGSPSVIDNIEK